MKFTELKLPETFTCPVCHNPLNNATVTRSGPNPQVKKGMIVICSNCTVVLRVGDSSLERMTPEQVNALPGPCKSAIMATKLVLTRILAKNEKPVDIQGN